MRTVPKVAACTIARNSRTEPHWNGPSYEQTSSRLLSGTQKEQLQP